MKELKKKIGIFFIILSIISPLFSFIVPYLGLSKAWSATLIGLFVAGLPEVFIVLGGILAGKEVVEEIFNRLKEVVKDKFRTALLLVFTYIATMGIGMYVMHGYFGYSYDSLDMSRVIFFVEIILSSIAVYFVVKFFKWSEVGFKELELKPLLWLLPMFFIIIFLWFSFFQKVDFKEFDWFLFALMAFTTMLVGFSEELVFRGVVLHTFLERFSPFKAILFSAILFSLLHSVNYFGGSPLDVVSYQMVFTFFFGVYFGFVALKLKNIIPLMIAHFLWDFTLLAVGFNSP